MKRTLVRILFISASLLILFLSLIPESPEIDLMGIDFLDKIIHFIAYCVLGIFFILSFLYQTSSKIKVIGFTVLFCLLYGGSIEILQIFTGRTFEILDILTDGIGGMAGSIFCLFFINFRPVEQS